jgi:hypothetical protein
MRILRKVGRRWLAPTDAVLRGHKMYDKPGGKVLASLVIWSQTDGDAVVCLAECIQAVERVRGDQRKGILPKGK